MKINQKSAIEALISGNYETKKPKELFYTNHEFMFLDNGNYFFACTTCLGTDTSFGKWKYVEGKIKFNTDIKCKSLANSQGHVFNNPRFIDFDTTELIWLRDTLVWKLNSDWSDTLVRL